MRLDLKRFEMLHYGRDYYGEIIVDIDFISPEGKRVYADRLSKRIKLKDGSFTELAKELSNALNEIIEMIKTEIPKINKQL
jgi:2-hydroxy-3-keto-5-methylthiopentenyl-1-phosphate phosphatase